MLPRGGGAPLAAASRGDSGGRTGCHTGHMTDTAWASAAVRRFARETNLVIAGRRFRVAGAGSRVDALRALLAALGAREEVGPVDHLWLVDADDPADDSEALVIDTSGAARPLRSPDIDSRLAWAREHMPLSAYGVQELDLAGLGVGVSMVLEPKTAVLALLLREAGARVVVFAHADETDDEVAEALRARGVPVFADSTVDLAGARRLALEFLRSGLDLLLDDGSHVIRLAHDETPELLVGMIGAAEETTSGLRPLRVMAQRGDLLLPVIAVNDARTKTWFDNRYGTGQSCVFAIFDVLDGLPAEAHRVRAGGHAVVAGFGPVGEGVAQALAALGLRVTVAELDPVRALQAAYAGYAVAELGEAVATADLVVSATGVRHTLDDDVLAACAPGAVLAVAGGVDQEVALDAVASRGWTSSPVATSAQHLGAPGCAPLLLLADGACVNIAAGEGNPIEIMDLSFATQLEAVRMLLATRGTLEPGVHQLDAGADLRVAARALHEQGIAVPPPVAAAAIPVEVATTRFGPAQ